MELTPDMTSAFYDELEKIAIARGRMKVVHTRKGRRPMRVDTLLKKEKDGTLYKGTGNEQKIAGVVPFVEGKLTGAEAVKPKKKGEVPSREDVETSPPRREDGRGSAATVLGSGNFLVAPGVGGQERSE